MLFQGIKVLHVQRKFNVHVSLFIASICTNEGKISRSSNTTDPLLVLCLSGLFLLLVDPMLPDLLLCTCTVSTRAEDVLHLFNASEQDLPSHEPPNTFVTRG